MVVKNLSTCVPIFVAVFAFAAHSAPNKQSTRRYIIAQNASTAKTSPVQSVAKNELRAWEFRTAPIALLASWYTLDAAYRINENFATGPTAVAYAASGTTGNMLSPTFKGSALGWQANYYFGSVTRNTFYLGARAYYESYRSYPHAVLGYEDHKGLRSNAFLGYQVKFNRFTWLTGLGVEYRDHDVTEHKDAAVNHAAEDLESHRSLFGPMVEVKLGFEI